MSWAYRQRAESWQAPSRSDALQNMYVVFEQLIGSIEEAKQVTQA